MGGGGQSGVNVIGLKVIILAQIASPTCTVCLEASNFTLGIITNYNKTN